MNRPSEQIGCRLLPAAAVSPTQHAPCERAGGAWKYSARRLVDQFSIKWNDSSTKLWLCAVLKLSSNTAIGDSGHSPSQWVLGRSLRLPFQLISRSSQLASHQRHRDDFACQRRVAMLAEAQRSIISTMYNKALSRAFLSRARSANNSPSQVRFAVGDHFMCWRGNNKRKSRWSMRWLGPGIVSGHVQTCIPVLSNSVYAPVRNPRVRWRSDVLEPYATDWFTTLLLCLRKLCPQPHHHGLHLCQSPVKRR